jgi:hypothetical protein
MNAVAASGNVYCRRQFRARSPSRWQKLLDEGVYTSVSEIGDAENISKRYISRILRLALLAPEILEAILAEQTNQSLVLEQLERPLPASWEEQRLAFLRVG